MGIDKVWHGVISKEPSSTENFMQTIEVGAVGVDGWNLRNGDVHGRRQSRLMGHLLEALRGNQQSPSTLRRWLDPTFTAVIHSSRSASEMDLHSRLTRGSAQAAACTVATNVRRRAKSTFFPILTVIL